MIADPLLLHEALDRVSIVLAIVEDHLLGHKAIAENAKWRAQVDVAGEALADLYQWIAAEENDL